MAPAAAAPAMPPATQPAEAPKSADVGPTAKDYYTQGVQQFREQGIRGFPEEL